MMGATDIAFLVGKAIDAFITLNNRQAVVDHITQEMAAGKTAKQVADELDAWVDEQLKAMDDAIAKAKSEGR